VINSLWPWRRPAADVARWVVVDVETTGLDASRDRLLAIAGVALHREGRRWRMQAVDSFEAVLCHADAAAVADKANILVHGIGIGEQQRGVLPAVALRAFSAWVGAAPVLGFHVGFDRQVIDRSAREALGEVPAHDWLDIAPLATLAHPAVKARALDEWLAHFGIECAARHQAAADVLATAELWLRLWPALLKEGGDLRSLQKLVASQRWLAGT